MVGKAIELSGENKVVSGERYICDLTLNQAIAKIYPDWRNFNYPHGPAGKLFKDGTFVSFNGRVGKIIYGYADFTDKKNIPLSQQNRNDLMKLGLLRGV